MKDRVALWHIGILVPTLKELQKNKEKEKPLWEQRKVLWSHNEV